MLTRASDYELTEVDAERILGKILPSTEGTAEACVVRQEDISYLVEMCREVAYLSPKWLGGRISSYDPKGLIPTKRVLEELQQAAINGFETQPSGVIDPAWVDDFEYPIGGLLNDHPLDRIYEATKLQRVTQTPVKWPLVGNDLRELYYDFKRMKRFMGEVVKFTSGKWSTIASQLADVAEKSLFFGPMVAGDGNMSGRDTTSTWTTVGFTAPFASRNYNTQGTTTYYSKLEGSLVILAGNRISRYDLAETVKCWINIGLEIASYGESGQETVVGNLVVPMNAVRSGSAEGTVFGSIGKWFYAIDAGNQMEQIIELARRWAIANVPRFATRPAYLSATLTNIHVDTGCLTLRSEIDSTNWAWEPQN